MLNFTSPTTLYIQYLHQFNYFNLLTLFNQLHQIKLPPKTKTYVHPIPLLFSIRKHEAFLKKKKKKLLKFDPSSKKKRKNRPIVLSSAELRNKHGSPDKSTIINTIAPSPSSPSHPLLHCVLIHEESSPLEGVPRSYRFIAMHRTASRPFDPPQPFAIYPRSPTAFLLRFGRASRGNSVTASLLEKGGKRARGRMVRVAECRVQLYQYPTRCRQGLRLAAWFTLRLCTVFVRMVCTKVILFSAVDEFT